MKTTNNNLLPYRGRLGGGSLSLALKSLWSRRKRNAWLFAELILVTIVCWAVLDPVIVTLYHKNLPLGYDKDRLCLVEFGIDPNLYKPGDDFGVLTSQVLKRFKTDFTTAEVESMCEMGQRHIEHQGGQSSVLQSDTTDTATMASLRYITFVKGTPLLETHGIKILYGEEDTKRFIENPDYFGTSDRYGIRDVMVISRATAKWFFGTENAVGKTIYSPLNTPSKVIGVYDDVRTSVSRHNEFTLLVPSDPNVMVVRLKDGADVETYCNMVREKIKDGYAVGCIGVTGITSYNQLIEDNSYRSGYTSKLRFNIALASLFLFSLCLGVIGTFWMQTKQRCGEVGVMRSFGASRNGIMRMIITEGAILSTASTLIGIFLYLQYAIKEGLNRGFYDSQKNEDGSPLTVGLDNASNIDWVYTFSDHFLIVSAIIYLIILIVVILGVSIPAHKLSRIPPVEALRED